MKRILLTTAIALAAATGMWAMSPRQAQKWVKSGEWSQGWTVMPDKSVNKVEFAEQFSKNREVWEAAFKFLATNDLATLPLGTHQIIEGRCWASVSEYEPAEESDANVEEHRRFIDLQYTMSGNEKMGLATNTTVSREYNPKSDMGMHTSPNIKYYRAAADRFFLFFPSDRHQPSVRDRGTAPVKSRKVVLKIEYAAK